MNKPLLIAGGVSGLIAATQPVAAINTTSAATIQTELVPIEILLFTFAASVILIGLAITLRGNRAIWLNAFAFGMSCAAFGCSFAFGSTKAYIINDTVQAVNIAYTNIGVTIATAALLVFSLLMLIASVNYEMSDEAERSFKQFITRR